MKRSVYDMTSCYNERLWEKKLPARQSILDVFFKKKVDCNSENETQPAHLPVFQVNLILYIF
jgi:hypothetical protein